MAISVTTAHFILFLVLIALPLAKPDHSLIEKACHNTEVPATCKACVNSDPDASKADYVGIAAIVVNCVSNITQILASEMSKMASSCTDKTLKPIFVECNQDYNKAAMILEGVEGTYLKKGKYDGANKSVRSAAEYHEACKQNVEDKKFHFPIEIAFHMRMFEELANAALRIIDWL